MKKKHYIILPAILVLLILIITSLIYSSINNALASVENNAGIIVPEKVPVYQFAMICENVEDSYWLSIKKGVEQASKEFNVAVEFNWPSSSNTDDQLKHMDMAIASRVDGIVAYVWDEQKASEIIDRAVDQGIPVITIGSDAKSSRRAAFVGANTYSYGGQLGRMLVAATGGKGDVVVLVSNDQIGGTVVQNLTISGIKDALKLYPGMKLKPIEYDHSDFLGIEDTIKDVLTNSPNLDAIVCTNARDTTLVAQRLIDLNKVGYKIVGSGDTMEILRYIDNGVVFGTVTASHEQMGYNAIKIMVDIKQKGRTSAYFAVNTQIITKENVAEYIKSGEEQNALLDKP